MLMHDWEMSHGWNLHGKQFLMLMKL